MLFPVSVLGMEYLLVLAPSHEAKQKAQTFSEWVTEVCSWFDWRLVGSKSAMNCQCWGSWSRIL